MHPPAPESLQRARVVVVGAGGLGCPAAWALAEAGVGRLTVLDPDRIEPSNLPRQVLYRLEDVGRSKAEVLAERLADWGCVVPRSEQLDETNEAAALAGADLVLDATDGALTKDWLNALAVRRGLPLVHAAALRSEGRLLEVPAGGRPCLACLFGRLDAETGTCADLGVWNGVVGATGFLAAATALRMLRDPDTTREGYVVLDFEDGRAIKLEAEGDDACPVCRSSAALMAETLPGATCAVSTTPAAAADLDLRDEQCPMNLLRARRVLEDLEPGARLRIRLGVEGRDSVPDGLRGLGHHVLETREEAAEGVVLVERGTRRRNEGPRLERDALLCYARQIVLPEVGEAGQRRLMEARVSVPASGAVLETAALYLAAAGVGEVRGAAGAKEDHADLGLPAQRALGCILADRLCRAIVLGEAPPSRFTIGPDGRIRT